MKKTATFFEKYQFLIAAVIVGVLFVYSNSRQTTQSESKETVKIDTVFVENGKTIDSLKAVIDDLQQNIGISVREQQAAAAVYQVKYYIDITEKRPANKVFFFGWCKRAIKEFIEYDNENKK